MGDTLLKTIKKTFYSSRWPCSDIYKNCLPRSPECIFQLRRRYMEFLQHPGQMGANSRLLFALQLVERASIMHQRLLSPGSFKCDLVKAAEAAALREVSSMAFVAAVEPPVQVSVASEAVALEEGEEWEEMDQDL